MQFLSMQSMILASRLQSLIDEIAGKPWHPVEVATVNDQVVRLVLCKGEFHWHKHTNEDELFFVLKGHLVIQMRPPHSDIKLKESELALIPRGEEHRPKSSEDTYVLMFEPLTLRSRGD